MVQPQSLDRLRQVSTSTIQSQLFKRGLRNTFLNGVRPVSDTHTSFAAPAFTLRHIPAREDLDVVAAFEDPTHPQRVAIETVNPGHVLVMDCGGDTRAASGGNILMTRLMVRGVAAMVTDASVRDSPAIAKMAFPVYSAGVSANLNLVAHHAVDLQVPIGCAGVPIFPGDVLVGDREGVVVIPQEIADQVADGAFEQERLEDFILKRVEQGAPVPGTYPPNAETLAAYRESLPGPC
jgi:regulator of RNase E activity RraA